MTEHLSKSRTISSIKGKAYCEIESISTSTAVMNCVLLLNKSYETVLNTDRFIKFPWYFWSVDDDDNCAAHMMLLFNRILSSIL
jgi:hypothetical protein